MRSLAAAATAVVILAALLAHPAHADSSRLARARAAIAAVDYEEARRLLGDALAAGGNGPAALAEIYALSARTAIVFEQRDVAEQFYRRWLAIDPAARLPDDTSPKLREAFDAARAFIAAHGRLAARATRGRGSAVEVELIADPLAMAHGARAADRTDAVLFANRRATLAPGAARVAILDEYGNTLLELAAVDAPAEPATSTEPPWTRRSATWAIAAGALGVVAAGLGTGALLEQRRADDIATHSGSFLQADADTAVGRARALGLAAGITGALAAAAVVPAIVLGRRGHAVAPASGPGGTGLAISVRF